MTGDLTLTNAASQAALSTDGIHFLGTGRYVEAAIYGPGEKVVEPEGFEVRGLADYPQLARRPRNRKQKGVRK